MSKKKKVTITPEELEAAEPTTKKKKKLDPERERTQAHVDAQQQYIKEQFKDL